MLTDLLPEAEQLIREKYNVLDIINLLYLDHDPLALYSRLKLVQKTHYLPTDRIIFLHLDTDFYIRDVPGYPGFLISNLQRILSELDIPNHFVLLVTNHKNISVELEKARVLYSGDSITIPYIICQLQQCWINPTKVVSTNLNENLITKKFSCLNGSNRIHRTKFIQLLKTKNLLDDGMVSYRQSLPVDNTTPEFVNSTSSNVHYLTTIPFTRVNDSWNLKKINLIIDDTIPEDIRLDGLANDINSRYQFLELQKSFVYVITETVFNYPHPFLSEKSYKGITAKRPFIMIGAKGSLQSLLDLGYKTFSDYWDESYDEIDDPADRMLSAFDQLNSLCQKSIDQLQDMLIDMNDILEHNFNNYKNSVDYQLIKLQKDLK